MDLIQRKESLSPLTEDVLTSGQFTATLATDTPLDHFFGRVQLSHEPGAASLPSSLPLMIGHDLTQLPIGKITRLGQKNGKTTGQVTLSRNVRELIGRDILDGIITDLSIGAQVDQDHVTHAEDGTLVANKWSPIEASLVAKGKDPGAKIHRALTMNDKTTANHETRVQEIRQIFHGLTGSDWDGLRIQALEGSDTVDTIRSQVTEQLKAIATKPVNTNGAADIQAGADQIDKFLDGYGSALIHRSQFADDASERKALEDQYRGSPFRGFSLLDAAREFLRSAGVDMTGMSREHIAHKALFVTRAGMATHQPGDFAQLLAANVNKALSKGYNETEETWMQWCGRDEVSDFKQAHRPVLSAFSDLDEIVNDGGYEYGTFSDKEEVFTMQRFGKLFGIGRTAIVNDDLAALSRVPRAMGRAAARKVGDEVYNWITLGHSTKTMNEDSTALFHANHSNYVASGAGAAISVPTLNAGRAAMATQTEQAGHTIRITPRHLICSEASLATAETIVAAAFNPATASGVEPMPGYIGRLNVVSDPRIDADVSTKWVLAANQANHDTVLVAFLDGISEPMLEEYDADVGYDGVVHKVRHEFTVYAGDYRGLYLNWGA